MTSTATTSTIVLVDPTSTDGESALGLLTDDDREVTLVVLLTGAASGALREYSRAEGIDLATAAWTYLEQVADRIAADGRTVEVVAASGPDTAFELATLAGSRASGDVLVPASIERLDRTVTPRLTATFGTALKIATPAFA